jgi:type I restriction enzyme S subunit
MIKNEVKFFDCLGGRLDVSFYRSRFNFTSKSFPSFHLSELLWVNPSVKYENLSANDVISFVPMEVIDEQNGKIAEQRTTTVSKTKGFTKFRDNDLIWAKITPCMQNGKSAIARNLVNGYGCGSTEFYVLRPKTDNVLIEYIHFILRDKRVLASAKNSFGGSAGQQRVSSGYLKSIQIPLPPIEIQQQIVELYNHAVAEKQSKEQEAKELLAGIDGYLLKELGIELPENVGNERCFEVSVLDLIGGRLDVFYNREYYAKLIQVINKSKYNVDFFGHLMCDLKNGVEIRNYVDNGMRYLRVTDLGENGLNDNSPRFVEVQKIPERIKLNEKCILISRSGSLGLINVFEPKLSDTILSSHIFKVELHTEIINPYYLEAYLRSKIGQLEIFRNNNGGVIPEINQGALRSLHIVVPPLEKQNEIAEYIQSIRAKAKRLHEEAREVLERLKREVEGMVEGKNNKTNTLQ